MSGLLLTSFFLFLFSFFNLLGIQSSLAYSQLFNFLIALIIFWTIRRYGRQSIHLNNRFFYWTFVVLMVITYIVGYEVKGSKRWIDLYFFNFQPSEFFKIFFIAFLADFFSQSTTKLEEISTFFKSIIYWLLPFLIIYKQPDLGNATVIFIIFAGLILFSYIPKKYLLFSGVLVIIFSIFFMFTLKDYQRLRLASFFNPSIDQTGTSYNMIQAIITVGSGGFFGRGLGLGTQSRYYFLPENRTDFAFSSLVEQFGMAGGLMVIILYFVIIYFLISKAIKYYYQKNQDGQFSFYYCLGLTTLIFFQMFINIDMNLGILPIAGIALPLISYGGSSTVSWMLGLALLP